MMIWMFESVRISADDVDAAEDNAESGADGDGAQIGE